MIPSNAHIHVFDYKGASLDDLKALADALRDRQGDAMLSWRSPDAKKFDGLSRLQDVLRDFKDQQGKSHGRADKWGPDDVLAIDSLSAVCELVWSQCFGTRIVLEPSEYPTAQGFLETLFATLCWDLKCATVVTAHTEDRTVKKYKQGTPDREKDFKQYPVLIGDKLKNVFAKYFSEVILAKRLGSNWYWDNQSGEADVKFRALPQSNQLKPDFTDIFTEHRKLDPERGPNVLLMGPPGSGKSNSLATIAAATKGNVYYLLLEPSSLPVLIKAWSKK